MAAALAWQESIVTVSGLAVRLRRAGKGPPLLVLHHDIGTLDELPLYASLAEQHDVLLPEHPGYGDSERPTWMRSVRDLAAVYQGLLAELGLTSVALLGLGYGGWIAAEMASMAPTAFAAVTLVGPMGIQPPDGDILDQAIVSHIDYARAGFHEQAAFDALYGPDPSTDQLVAWDICREMNFRLAWKPYMRSLTLKHLLGAVRAPTMIVWGAEDRIVPASTAAIWQQAMPRARLTVIPDCGHCVDMERPAALLAAHLSTAAR
ncbi:MAG: alpha/beta hydrolase [Alphaproteobacteria bacterium]|nr:alpha/beta hydrolase [Alphaproteobacteria bacterium]